MVGINGVRVVRLDSVPPEDSLVRLVESATPLHLDAAAGIALAATPVMARHIETYIAGVARNPASIRPRDSLLIEPSLPTAKVVQALDLRGPGCTFGDWPDGGWHALAWADAQIRLGRAPQMLVGAWEEEPARIVWVLLGHIGANSLAAIAQLRWTTFCNPEGSPIGLDHLASWAGCPQPMTVAVAGGSLHISVVQPAG